MMRADDAARWRGRVVRARLGARPGPPAAGGSVVEGLDVHPRSRRSDLRIVRRGRLPLLRGDPGVHGLLIGEVQLGDPVEGLFAAVEHLDKAAGLGAPETGN